MGGTAQAILAAQLRRTDANCHGRRPLTSVHVSVRSQVRQCALPQAGFVYHLCSRERNEPFVNHYRWATLPSVLTRASLNRRWFHARSVDPLALYLLGTFELEQEQR